MAKVICNTTPIIALASIGKLDLLLSLYKQIIIPKSVELEIISGGKIIIPDIHEIKWITVIEDVKNESNKLLYSLDEGEKQVILSALQLKANKIIIDERKARKIGSQLGLNIIGTLGVLVKAKKVKLISNFRNEALKLIKNGLYYDLALIDELSLKIDR